jgi:hypothetical protein
MLLRPLDKIGSGKVTTSSNITGGRDARPSPAFWGWKAAKQPSRQWQPVAACMRGNMGMAKRSLVACLESNGRNLTQIRSGRLGDGPDNFLAVNLKRLRLRLLQAEANVT